jgi:hypothetical protein
LEFGKGSSWSSVKVPVLLIVGINLRLALLVNL